MLFIPSLSFITDSESIDSERNKLVEPEEWRIPDLNIYNLYEDIRKISETK